MNQTTCPRYSGSFTLTCDLSDTIAVINLRDPPALLIPSGLLRAEHPQLRGFIRSASLPAQTLHADMYSENHLQTGNLVHA